MVPPERLHDHLCESVEQCQQLLHVLLRVLGRHGGGGGGRGCDVEGDVGYIARISFRGDKILRRERSKAGKFLPISPKCISYGWFFIKVVTKFACFSYAVLCIE